MNLSEDLKRRIVKAYEDGETQIEVSKRFMVSQSTVSRTLAHLKKTGSHKPKPKPGRPREHNYDAFVSEKLREKSDITYAELKDAIEEYSGVRVSDGTITQTFKRLNVTRKKRRSMTRPKI